jgi:hypothetical protein
MTEERKGELKTFGAKCKTFSAIRKQKEAEMQQPPVEELTVDQKLDNMAENMSNALNSHAQALNALAYYIEEHDNKVKKAGGLIKWVEKDITKKQRIEQKKAEYAQRKA